MVTAGALRGHGMRRSARNRANRGEERVLGRLIGGEAEPPALAHVSDDLDRAAEIGIGVPWRGEAAEVGLSKIFAFGDAGARPARHPPSAVPAAAPNRRTVLVREPNPRGDASPHPLPAEYVRRSHTLNAWSRAAGVVAAQTKCLARRPASVMSVRPSHWAGEPGKRNGRPNSAAQRGVYRQRGAHVHCIAHRHADHRMRAMHAPGEAVGARRRRRPRPPARNRNSRYRGGLAPRGMASVASCPFHRPRTARDSASGR